MEISRERLLELISPFKGLKGATIPVLQAVQDEYGYLPRESFGVIEEILSIPSSKAFGVATFYAQFRLDPVGKHIIKVCDGTACHVKGSETLLTALKDYLDLDGVDTTEDRSFTLEQVACLGCCSLAPVMMIDDTTYGSLTIEKMRSIIDEYRNGGGSGE
jgi:NADH-quinone oxidoreductase subunit E